LVPELLLLLVLVDALLVVFVLPLALSPPAPPEFELPSLRQPAMDDHTVSTPVSVPMPRKTHLLRRTINSSRMPKKGDPMYHAL